MRFRIVALQLVDAVGYPLGFAVSVSRREESELAAHAASGLQLFADAAPVVRHHGGRGVQNDLTRTIILLDAEDLCGGEILSEPQNDAGIGASPAINGLVFIAYNAKVRIATRQQEQQFVLDAI